MMNSVCLAAHRVQAIFPTNPDHSMLRDWRMNHLVQYARKVEGDMYDTAASRVSSVARFCLVLNTVQCDVLRFSDEGANLLCRKKWIIVDKCSMHY